MVSCGVLLEHDHMYIIVRKISVHLIISASPALREKYILFHFVLQFGLATHYSGYYMMVLGNRLSQHIIPHNNSKIHDNMEPPYIHTKNSSLHVRKITLWYGTLYHTSAADQPPNMVSIIYNCKVYNEHHLESTIYQN